MLPIDIERQMGQRNSISSSVSLFNSKLLLYNFESSLQHTLHSTKCPHGMRIMFTGLKHMIQHFSFFELKHPIFTEEL